MAKANRLHADETEERWSYEVLTRHGYRIEHVSGSLQDGNKLYRVTGPGGNGELVNLTDLGCMQCDLRREEMAHFLEPDPDWTKAEQE